MGGGMIDIQKSMEIIKNSDMVLSIKRVKSSEPIVIKCVIKKNRFKINENGQYEDFESQNYEEWIEE